MGKVRYLIEIYNKQSDGSYSGTADLSVTDAIAFNADKSIEATADTFSFRLMNTKLPDGTYQYQDDDVKADDRVLLYITSVEDITDGNKSGYQIFDGLVVEVVYEESVDKRSLLVKGFNRFEKLLNYTHPSVYENQTASAIIQNLITQVNDGQIGYDNSVNQITWDSGNASTSTAISYYRNYRPVYEMIEELSRLNLNKEFNAYYYIDNDNNFIWLQKSNDNDTLELVEGEDFVKIKINEKVWDVINAMIVDCGTDPAGRHIHAMYYDEQSAAKYGLKWANTIEVENEIANTIKKEQRALTAWVDNSDENKQEFPDNSVYPLTLSFLERSSGGVPGATTAVATNDASFKNQIRKEAKWIGVEWIKHVLELTGEIKPRVDIDMIGSHWETGAGRTATNVENCLDSSGNPIIQGDMVLIKTTSRGTFFGDTGIRLRCVAINHEVSKNGWVVTMKFKEDVEDFNPDYNPTR